MSEIKAIETMRKFINDQFGGGYAYSQGMAIADNIEAEIADKYMRLPVDADGVPIHLYDKLLKSTGAPKPTYGEVVGISDDSVFFNAKKGWETNWSKLTRHVKPRTVEDILCELEGLRGNGAMYEDVVTRAAILARELRELLGGDAS